MKLFVAFLGAATLAGLTAAQSPRRVARFNFGPPANLGPVVNGPAFDGGPSISTDGLPNISADGATLFFMSDRPGGSGRIDLWQAGYQVRARRRR